MKRSYNTRNVEFYSVRGGVRREREGRVGVGEGVGGEKALILHPGVESSESAKFLVQTAFAFLCSVGGGWLWGGGGWTLTTWWNN